MKYIITLILILIFSCKQNERNNYLDKRIIFAKKIIHYQQTLDYFSYSHKTDLITKTKNLDISRNNLFDSLYFRVYVDTIIFSRLTFYSKSNNFYQYLLSIDSLNNIYFLKGFQVNTFNKLISEHYVAYDSFDYIEVAKLFLKLTDRFYADFEIIDEDNITKYKNEELISLPLNIARNDTSQITFIVYNHELSRYRKRIITFKGRNIINTKVLDHKTDQLIRSEDVLERFNYEMKIKKIIYKWYDC